MNVTVTPDTPETQQLPHATAPDPTVRPQQLADAAILLAQKWLTEAAEIPASASAERLAGVLDDPNGLAFTVGFVDGVVRAEDRTVAARKLQQLVPLTPKFLPRIMRAALTVGGALARFAPGIVVPIARTVLRQMVKHLILDATEHKLGSAIDTLTRTGVSLNLNLLGEAILGQQEAAHRLAGTHRLLARADVDYVSIKVSSTVSPISRWAFDEAAQRIETKLLPLFERANAAEPKKFINLDMEEYSDLELTLTVFMRLLDRPELQQLEAGIVLQTYLPDALSVMMRVQEWAAARVDRGGAPIKVRVVKGANLPMEQVEAAIHGWPAATWPSKQHSDTSYKAVLDYALHPERVRNVRVGVAGHNLFDIALAWLLAEARGVSGKEIEFEMLLGMATGQAEAVRREVGGLRLYVPVVHPKEFDAAIAYLVRRLEEGSSQENFMSALSRLHTDSRLFERETQRFLSALAALTEITGDGSVHSYQIPQPRRSQDRMAEHEHRDPESVRARIETKIAAGQRGEFQNTPDTDPVLLGNRVWGRTIVGRMLSSDLGRKLAEDAVIGDAQELDAAIRCGVQAASAWQARGAQERTRVLYRAAELLEARRGELLEVMGAECGKTLEQGDPEVSEAIDFANYYAMLGQQLEQLPGATPVPQRLIAVIPPWNFPAAIPAGGVLAGLASGAAVIVKPATRAVRTCAVLVEALWQAGVPGELLQLVRFHDRSLGSQFVADPRIDRLILTGSYETALAFRKLREDVPILAETSGKNAIIVTPHADVDLAVKDVVHSAFGHAGQKCSAASLVILVGSVATSTRFRNQLIDAVTSLQLGTPDQLQTQIGPLIAAPSGKLLRGLTVLGEGERWLVQPTPDPSRHPFARDMNGEQRLWHPGVRDGVARGSEYHLTEYFGPILGIMTANTLDEAIDIVNETDYGLTSGLHSLDRDEIARWLGRIQAGNLYVNRGITGAIVRRQPFGGWKKSAIGAGGKAGGPNYLHALVDWRDAPASAIDTDTEEQTFAAPCPAAAPLLAAIAEAVSGAELAWLRAACGSDAAAWAETFGVASDVSGLDVERNLLRYLPVSVMIRASQETPLVHVVRVIAASLAAQATPQLSTPIALPGPVMQVLHRAGVTVHGDDDAAWQRRVHALAERSGHGQGARVRVVAGDDRSRLAAVRAVYTATRGAPEIAVYGGRVVTAGRVEMLPHLREQAVSITAHRFGTPHPLSVGLI